MPKTAALRTSGFLSAYGAGRENSRKVMRDTVFMKVCRDICKETGQAGGKRRDLCYGRGRLFREAICRVAFRMRQKDRAKIMRKAANPTVLSIRKRNKVSSPNR